MFAAAAGATPPLLFGIRLWLAVCLALYVAFWLELDNAYWAGTSAALVCQPRLGASLRKGWFRMIGTVVGAVAIVLLTACFAQNRDGFFLSLAMWGGLSALVATLLRNFAAYAAALAGFTAAIIAGDELGAVGGANGEAFTFAITRVSEIWIGIVCAGIVLAGTDFGGGRRRLAALFAELTHDLANRFLATLRHSGSAAQMQAVRRELIRRVIAIDPVIDEVKGESSTLRYHSPLLQQAVDAMFVVLAAWRTIEARVRRAHYDPGEAGIVLHTIPAELRQTVDIGHPTAWLTDPKRKRDLLDSAIDRLANMPAPTISLRLLADQTAFVLAGFSRILDGLALLAGDYTGIRAPEFGYELHVPDWLPALINAGRAFTAILAMEVFWVWSEWPNGALAITFTAITVIVMSPRADEAYAAAISFTIGTMLAVLCAGVILFAGLPNVTRYAGFSLVLGLYLIPVGAMMAQSWRPAIFVPMAGNFLPLLSPANQMHYDATQFFNTAVAIVAGCCVGALSMRLLPPLSPAFRSRRLLAMSLRDLCRLGEDPLGRGQVWEGRLYARIAALPEQAEPVERAVLITALTVGRNIIRLQRLAPELGFDTELEAALKQFSSGNLAAAVKNLRDIDEALAAAGWADDRSSLLARRARSQLLAVCDSLSDHWSYFERGVAS